MPRYAQLQRFLQAARLLARPAGATIDEIAETLGVTRRTVYRDLEALQDCGLPVQDDDGLPKRWRIREGLLETCRLVLEPDELLLLQLVAADLRGSSEPGFAEAADSLLAKVRALLPTGQRVKADALRERVVSAPGPKPAAGTGLEWLGALLDAVAACESVVVQYRSRSPRGPGPRRLDPQGLVPRRGVLYLLARPEGERALRNYRLDRIEAVKRTGESFEPVGAEQLRAHFETRFGVHGGEPEEVEIWFDEEAAEFVRERDWHASQELEERRDGSLVLRMRVSGLVEVKSWAQSFGASATVLQPRWLADEIAEEAGIVASRARARKSAAPPTRRAARRRP